MATTTINHPLNNKIYYFPNEPDNVIKTQPSIINSISDMIYNHSIFKAFNYQEIKEELTKNEESSYKNIIFYAAKFGAQAVLTSMIASPIISGLVTIAFSSSKTLQSSNVAATTHLTNFAFSSIVVIGPIFEEIICRGVIQNVFAAMQKAVEKIAEYIMPASFTENRVFCWLTSASARIIGANVLFGAAHLSNGGGYLSTAQAVAQVANILMFPGFSLIYETTGTIFAPIVAHMVNNFIVYMLLKI